MKLKIILVKIWQIGESMKMLFKKIIFLFLEEFKKHFREDFIILLTIITIIFTVASFLGDKNYRDNEEHLDALPFFKYNYSYEILSQSIRWFSTMRI